MRAEQGEHEPFGQHLADQPPLPRAERRADRQLAIAAGGAHQQEVRDVGAGDEEDQEDEHLEEVERRAQVADQLIANRHA